MDFALLMLAWLAIAAIASAILGASRKPAADESRLARCARCSYDLSGIPAGAACPECGATSEQRDRHFDTRVGVRNLLWSLAFVAAIVCVLIILRIVNSALPIPGAR